MLAAFAKMTEKGMREGNVIRGMLEGLLGRRCGEGVEEDDDGEWLRS